VAQGIPFEVVPRLGGHSSLTITADIDAHFVPALQREAR
jgi:hypothetical protein